MKTQVRFHGLLVSICALSASDTIELMNGAGTAWDMSQACLRHIWKPGLRWRSGNLLFIINYDARV